MNRFLIGATVGLAFAASNSPQAASSVSTTGDWIAQSNSTAPQLDLTNFEVNFGSSAIASNNFDFAYSPSKQGWKATLTNDWSSVDTTSGETDNSYKVAGGSWFYWKADPVIDYEITLIDNGAPSNFNFHTEAEIDPVVTGFATATAEFSGEIVDGGNGSAGITPRAPTGIPVDSDGATEIQVVSFSKVGDATLINMKYDLGLGESFTGAPGAVHNLTYAEGDTTPRNIAAPGWDFWQIDIAFRGTGGGDAYFLRGSATLTPEGQTSAVPVPAAFWFFSSAAGLAGMLGRRKGTSNNRPNRAAQQNF